jgi:large subunit ribosomal protein L3
MKSIIGRKLGMTQIFTDKGEVIPVTVVEAGPCFVVQVKTTEKDGYDAVVVAFEDIKKARANKPETGTFKKANVTPKRFLREIKLDGTYNLGDKITCEQFIAGDVVDVTGFTKGRGFTGTIKRWNFQRQRMTHGNSRSHRVVGSMGSNTWPARVIKNKKMPGQYGNEQVTIQNLTVVKIDADKNCLFVKGGIPGCDGALVSIRTAVKGGAK